MSAEARVQTVADTMLEIANQFEVASKNYRWGECASCMQKLVILCSRGYEHLRDLGQYVQDPTQLDLGAVGEQLARDGHEENQTLKKLVKEMQGERKELEKMRARVTELESQLKGAQSVKN